MMGGPIRELPMNGASTMPNRSGGAGPIMTGLLRQAADEGRLLWIEGGTIGAEDIVEPDLRVGAVGDGGVPGIFGIGLARDEPPVDRRDILVF